MENPDKQDSKTKRRMSLLVKLTGISVIFLLLAMLIFSIISVYSIRSSSMEIAIIMGHEKLSGGIKYFEKMISDEYGQLSLQNGKLTGQNGIVLEYRYKMVDKFSSDMGIVATVFVKEGNDFRRISTSIVNNANERVVDTFLGTNSAAYSSVRSGNDYIGNAVILGHDYLTFYRPVISPDGKEVIAILFIGTEMTKIGDTIAQKTAKSIKLILVIAVTILLILIIVNTMSLNYVLMKPIRTVTGITGRLSQGHIDLEYTDSYSNDETGEMISSLLSFVDSLKRTAGFARDIGRGNLNAEFQPLSDNDVLGVSILEMRQNLLKSEHESSIRAIEEKHQNWVTEGLAKFAEILRKDNDNMAALSYNVTSHLVKYMEINQGGMFVINETENDDERFLELTACYAYDRKKFHTKQIRPGEGLVGACFLERKPIYLECVPDDYVNIESGLGDASPKAIYICPLVVNDIVYGVIELASFAKFEQYKLDFVNRVSESIASTLSTVRVNIRTTRLLEQTRLQAEEMVNQQEELRQTMEEMQATHEESQRREHALEETIRKLEDELGKFA